MGACNINAAGQFGAGVLGMVLAGGGRVPRQPGQVRKEAALTSSTRVTVQPPKRRLKSVVPNLPL